MAKYYFDGKNAEGCYPLKYFLDYMKENGIQEMKVIEAKIEYGTDHFYCSRHDFCGETGMDCGTQCTEYEPRNGKNGRCRFHRNTYEHTEKTIIITNH